MSHAATEETMEGGGGKPMGKPMGRPMSKRSQVCSWQYVVTLQRGMGQEKKYAGWGEILDSGAKALTDVLAHVVPPHVCFAVAPFDGAHAVTVAVPKFSLVDVPVAICAKEGGGNEAERKGGTTSIANKIHSFTHSFVHCHSFELFGRGERRFSR